MSVRATGSLIGDAVITSGIKGPKMVVQSVEEQKKLVTTVWFSDDGQAQTAVFPASALDRADAAPKAAVKSSGGTKTGTGKRGRPARK
jgi:uncharacterized protein YodC (DUF2158 family)